jgi:hypothetical protein
MEQGWQRKLTSVRSCCFAHIYSIGCLEMILSATESYFVPIVIPNVYKSAFKGRSKLQIDA